MSSPEKYTEQPNESSLDWSTYDQACDFFVLISGKAKEAQPIRNVLSSMLEKNENVSLKEKWTVLIKAWNLYVISNPITEENISLCYEIDKDGINRLAEEPTIGGIDLAGDSIIAIAEVEERKAEAREEKIASKLDKKPPKKKATKKKVAKKPTKKKPTAKPSGDFIVGDNVLVDDSTDAEAWPGEIREILGRNARIKVANGYQGAGTLLPARLSDLTRL